jgi:hypothetical protein
MRYSTAWGKLKIESHKFGMRLYIPKKCGDKTLNSGSFSTSESSRKVIYYSFINMDEQDSQDEKGKIINPVYPVYQCVTSFEFRGFSVKTPVFEVRSGLAPGVFSFLSN